MRLRVSIAVLLSSIWLSACGGPVSSRAVRERIATLGGAELSPDDVRVERIVTETGSRAVAEFTVQMAGLYQRNADGEWTLVSVRLSDDRWIDLARLEAVLAAIELEETTSNLRMLADGVEAWARENGALPEVSGADSLPDLLHPLFVPDLVREDAWGSAFLYETSGGAFRLRSPGPDRQPGTPDDIEVSGPSPDR